MNLENVNVKQIQLYLKFLYNDKILVLTTIVAVLLTIGNIVNKLLLGFEPLQYSLFSYDKVPHFLMAIILVRCIYWFYHVNTNGSQNRLLLKSSFLTILIYGVIWEIYELSTFYIQSPNSNQFWLELYDVPLDWLYDVGGILASRFLGFSSKTD